VKEDVLRILGERREKVSMNVIELEIKTSSSFLFKTIRNLEEDNLIDVEEKFILLTKKGRNEAKNIVKKHNIIEDYFRETRNEREAHQAAHLLEHYVSEEVINNIKKLSTLKKEGVPLTQFQLYSKGIITDIFLSNYGLFERIVSMGIFLGEMIIIQNEVPHALIVKIRNKKFALDKNIAEEIRAVEYERS
jgi:Mn-dependent DtxR family transcriptional regulator/Fe2+ transport system protein FeoA